MPDITRSAVGSIGEAGFPVRTPDEKDLFLTFAFASAEVLIESSAVGRITFATGAVRAHFGRAPEDMLGLQVSDLVVPADQRAFINMLAILPTRHRLLPTLLRVAGPGHRTMSVAALSRKVAGRADGFCLTFSMPPTTLDTRPADGEILLAEVRRRVTAGSDGAVGLFELPPGAAPQVIAALQASCGPAHVPALVAEVAPGRFGLLPQDGTALPDLAKIAARLQAEFEAPVQTAAVPLSANGLTPDQTTRTLRHILKLFSRSGVTGVSNLGAAQGLDAVATHVAGQVAAVRRLISERRFRLEYQPIVRLSNRAVHHHETLLRPGEALPGGDASPATLVATAEAVGLTAELDLAVFAEALAGLRPEAWIAVNLSGLSVQSATFRDALLRQIAAHPDAARRLMVELTESAEIEDEDAAAKTLSVLRSNGIPVCLDDFGAGAAAFRYLKAFQVDYVKIDGSFVTAAVSSGRDRAFVASMVELSRAVGASVVAERIETEEECLLMQSLGVEYGQGWLFGRPGPLPVPSAATHSTSPERVVRCHGTSIAKKELPNIATAYAKRGS